jgi:hypothetical protein
VPLTDKSALLSTKAQCQLELFCSSVCCMELIWSNAGALGEVLTVLSEVAGLVLIGERRAADHHVLALASTLRCLLERSLCMQQPGGYAAIPV